MRATIFMLISIALFATSCNQSKTGNSITDIQQDKAVSNQKMDVPYLIGERYFIKNTVEGQTQTLQITSKNDFDKYFGSATVMGNEGKPTPIDFSKQYVIAVIGEKSEYKVAILPLSLKSEDDTITLQYKVETEEKQTYTSRALLILIVDNKYHRESIEFERR